MTDNGLFPFTSEHEMIRNAARDFAQNEISPIAAEFDESGEFPSATIQKMGEMGFMRIEVPEEYGGAGMDTLAYVLALEEVCKADASHGKIMSVNNSLFCYGILKYGTEAQKQKYLRGVATGERVGAYSLTEPMSGSDAGTMRSRAVRDGDSYLINGRKSWHIPDQRWRMEFYTQWCGLLAEFFARRFVGSPRREFRFAIDLRGIGGLFDWHAEAGP